MLRYLPFLLVLALWIYAFIDCLTTQEDRVRYLPKVVWVIIVLLFGQVLLGPVAWLAVGKQRGAARPGGGAGDPRGQRQRFVAPDDNPEFLKSLETRGKSADPGDPRDGGTTGDEDTLTNLESDPERDKGGRDGGQPGSEDEHKRD